MSDQPDPRPRVTADDPRVKIVAVEFARSQMDLGNTDLYVVDAQLVLAAADAVDPVRAQRDNKYAAWGGISARIRELEAGWRQLAGECDGLRTQLDAKRAEVVRARGAWEVLNAENVRLRAQLDEAVEIGTLNGQEADNLVVRAEKAEAQLAEAKTESAVARESMLMVSRDNCELRAQLDEILKIHKDRGSELGVKPWCGHCQVAWPCPTAAVLADTPAKEEQ